MKGKLWCKTAVFFFALAFLFHGSMNAQDTAVTRQVTTPEAEVKINQIETSQFPKVVIFATVIKDGVPVPGLTEKDFLVREDEVEQKPLTVVPKLTPLSAVLTLDISGSMKDRLLDSQRAAKSFLKLLKPEDRVQVISFSRDVKTIYPMGADLDTAGSAIDGTAARGATALWDALYASVESLRGVSGRKAIILLSDGVDDDGTGKPLSKRKVADVLELARMVNVPIYAIGLGTTLDEIALKKTADETGALYLNAIESGELSRLYDDIGKQLAGQYTIYYTSNLPADGTEHRVQLNYGDSAGMKAYIPAAEKPAASAAVVEVPTKELFIAPGKAKLGVKLGPDSPILTHGQPGMWRILEAQADFEGRRKQLAMHHDAQPVVTLNEGEYMVQVDVGDAGRMAALHVKEGSPAQGVIVLGAGQVKLGAKLGQNSPIIANGEPGMWRILESEADFEGRRKQIAMHHDARQVVTLNEGQYVVQVKVGDASQTANLSLKAGEQKPVDVVIGAGQVKLVARLGAGTPPLTHGEPGMWRILEAKEDFAGNRKQVTMHHDAQPVVTLNEGDYMVQVKVGNAAQTAEFTLKAGEQKVIEVDVTAKR